MKERIALFVCVGNSCRSQMAEAIFNDLARGIDWKARSAGTKPEDEVDPHAVEALREIGLTPNSRPKLLTPELASEASLVITMGCIDDCPYVPGKRMTDWEIEDPKGKGIEEYRAVRDELYARIRKLMSSDLGYPPGDQSSQDQM
ncbi:MAG: low molecular weight phosphatase family protein [Thermoplasmata archaeon]